MKTSLDHGIQGLAQITHPNTVAEQIHPLMATALPASSHYKKLLRN